RISRARPPGSARAPPRAVLVCPRLRYRVDEGEEAQDRIGAHVAVRARPVADGGAHDHRVAALDVGHGAGGDLADPLLELGRPRLVRPRGADDVEDELDVGPELLRPLPDDELVLRGALPPVDVARVVALAHLAERVDVVAAAAAHG